MCRHGVGEHIKDVAKVLTVGEWHGLVVSTEACHSKGRGFESPSQLYLLKNVSFEEKKMKKKKKKKKISNM